MRLEEEETEKQDSKKKKDLISVCVCVHVCKYVAHVWGQRIMCGVSFLLPPLVEF